MTKTERKKKRRVLEHQCDQACKNVLSYAAVMGYILKELVPELHALPMDDIKTGIAGSNALKVDLKETELTSEVEGLIRLDLHFAFKDADRHAPILEFNVEAQNDGNPSYSLFHRGAYYMARMRSLQLGRVFSSEDYDAMTKIYSIWLIFRPIVAMRGQVFFVEEILRCGSTPESDITELKTKKLVKTAVGCYIGLGEPDLSTCQYYVELLKFLNVLFGNGSMSAEDRMRKLEHDFGIKINNELRMEIEDMCTYSAAVFDQGFDHGFDHGFDKGQDKVLNQWFKKTLAFLLKQKREGKLQETVWDAIASTCPKKELMPKLQKAVAEA